MGYSPIPDFPAVPPETDRTSEVSLLPLTFDANVFIVFRQLPSGGPG